jgi:hypothetical protein
MPNEARIVTNQEVIKFIPSISTIEDKNGDSIVIKTVEVWLFTSLKNRGVCIPETDFEAEEIDIFQENLSYGNILTRGITSFKLKNRPVAQFNSLKIVNSRSALDGTIEDTTTIPRNYYRVSTRGIVSMLRPVSEFVGISSQVFPTGPGSMVADYTAGFDLLDDDVLATDSFQSLKLLLLMMIDRVHQLQRQELWYQQGVSAVAGSITTFIRVDMTAEERDLFNKFVETI